MRCKHFVAHTTLHKEQLLGLTNASPTLADKARAGLYAHFGFIQVIDAYARLSKSWHTTCQPSTLGHVHKLCVLKVATNNHLSCVLTCQ